MAHYQELIELLNDNHIEYREHGDELTLGCLFNDCDADSRRGETHLYINKLTGLYACDELHILASRC